MGLEAARGFPFLKPPSSKSAGTYLGRQVRGIEETGVNLDKVTRQMAAQLGN